jgi:Mn2+/Fe2+ NRAMP family transporter
VRASLRPRAARRFLRSIGPELVSSASDNDPTNVGTAVAVGARTAYQLTWVALLIAPLLAVVQTIAAHVGAAAQNDLQTLARERYGRRIAGILLVSVVIVNVVTIAADLQAGAAGIGLLVGVDSRWLIVPLGLGLVVLLLMAHYDRVVAVLRYAMVGFLAFGAVVVLAHPDWPRVLRSSLVPTLSFRPYVLAGALALLGTTLTSYVYVWETIGRGTEEPPVNELAGDRTLARARVGAVVGAMFTALVLWLMIVASAATLGRHDVDVTSIQGAAQVLRPVAGPASTSLFALGLIVSAVVALPVLIATTAYVIGAHFDWRRGLSEQVRHARGFYAVVAASVGLAFIVTWAKVSVVAMLVAASGIGGIGTPVGIVILVLLARDNTVMNSTPISAFLAGAGWTVAAVVGGCGGLFLVGAALGKF